MKRRTLALRSEHLGELTHEELTGVAAGAANDITTPLVRCVTDALNCVIYDPNSVICQVVSRRVC